MRHNAFGDRLSQNVVIKLWLLLSLSLYTCKSHRDSNDNAPLLASENIKLYNHRICTIAGVNAARCYVLCRFKQPGCKSFNYDVQGKQCQFSNGTAEEYPSDVRAEADVNYFDLKKKVGEQYC